MARIFLDEHTYLEVYWNGDCLVIDESCIDVGNWWRAVFNYSTFDDVIKRFVVELVIRAGFDIVHIEGDWRV